MRTTTFVSFAALLLATSCSGSGGGAGPREAGAWTEMGSTACTPSSADLGTTIPDGGGLTWNGYVHGFMLQYCVSCHTGKDSSFPTGSDDFCDYKDVQAVAAAMRCGVAPCGMPPSGCVTSSGAPAPTGCPGPFGSCPPAGQFPVTCSACSNGKCPTAAQRMAIVKWVDDGAPM